MNVYGSDFFPLHDHGKILGRKLMNQFVLRTFEIYSSSIYSSNQCVYEDDVFKFQGIRKQATLDNLTIPK